MTNDPLHFRIIDNDDEEDDGLDDIPDTTTATLDQEARQEAHDLITELCGHLETDSEVSAYDETFFGKLSSAISLWNTAQGFWESDNTGEKIALMHSELSEMLEADRLGLQSDKIPEFSGVEEEAVDLLIRLLDFAGHYELRLQDAFTAKLRYNLTRPRKHGKAY